jgi:hypothetical protein
LATRASYDHVQHPALSEQNIQSQVHNTLGKYRPVLPSFLQDRLLQLRPISQLNLLRPDRNEHGPASLVGAVDPLMVDASLDNVLTSAHRLLVAVVEPEDDLARQDDGVVHAQRPVHRHREVARDIGDAEDNATRRAPWQHPRVLPRRLLVVHRHRPTPVEHGERRACGPEGPEQRDLFVRAEDRLPVCCVRRHDYSRV